MPIDVLPNDLETLRALVNQLSSERDAAIAESRRLTEQNDDAEEEEHQNDAADKPADQRKKRRANRGALPAHLPHVHVTLEPESTVCPCCHGAMHVIGEESSQRLDKIPAQYQVIVTHRPKYGGRACFGCEGHARAPQRRSRSDNPREAPGCGDVVHESWRPVPQNR